MIWRIKHRELVKVSEHQDEYTVRETSLLDHLYLSVDGGTELCEYGLSHSGSVYAFLSHPQLRVLGEYSDVYYSVEQNSTKLRGGGGCPLLE